MSAQHQQTYVCLSARLKVRTGGLGSNSSLSVSSRPDVQDAWDLLKPSSSLVSSAGARSARVFVQTNLFFGDYCFMLAALNLSCISVKSSVGID